MTFNIEETWGTSTHAGQMLQHWQALLGRQLCYRLLLPLQGHPEWWVNSSCRQELFFPRNIMIKSCKSSMPHSARWRHFLGKGRDGAIPGAEILKRRLSSEKWLGMTYSNHLTSQNNRNNSTSTASTAELALFSPFIQRLHLYHATRILIHSLTISCLDYCNNVCAKLLFFFL